tara:strand:- start:283 stop:531 length:249 start_codon:yes stop_codon:yes gene_type:complete
MKEEKTNKIGDEEIKDEDMSPEQRLYKSHVLSLRNKIEKLKFEIDELLPSLRFHENALLETVKKQADENFETEENQVIGEQK